MVLTLGGKHAAKRQFVKKIIQFSKLHTCEAGPADVGRDDCLIWDVGFEVGDCGLGFGVEGLGFGV